MWLIPPHQPLTAICWIWSHYRALSSLGKAQTRGVYKDLIRHCSRVTFASHSCPPTLVGRERFVENENNGKNQKKLALSVKFQCTQLGSRRQHGHSHSTTRICSSAHQGCTLGLAAAWSGWQLGPPSRGRGSLTWSSLFRTGLCLTPGTGMLAESHLGYRPVGSCLSLNVPMGPHVSYIS